MPPSSNLEVTRDSRARQTLTLHQSQNPSKAKKTQESPAKASAPSPTERPYDSLPRLKLSDLEFEYDHSQLRDPRPTPGRERKPHYTEFDLSEEFLSQFYIPKNKNPRNDPTHFSYDLHKCHNKGPNGTPSYDVAGFQLDYKKVEKWMKPVSYNKKSIVNGMTRRLEKDAQEEKDLFEIFFVGGKGPDKDASGSKVKDYIKDHISKDLGVPWHMIDSKRARKWEEQGFKQVKANEWWHEPNAEEKKRMSKMHEGADLRKFL
ncbi:hypothetical protein FSARC_6515 [Fusarium sarcochroum]|uniref:Uncharacterized protein n=1 Tax=Fusarium sarcochroum TaxID=1208366 RepID=A0A8H4X8D5_9HYPO|nr:hypothetical protein FSARC_6515 [Fusarium sarcochroum]